MKKIIPFLLLCLLAGTAFATDTAITATVSLDALNDYQKAPGAWTALAGNGSYNYYAWPSGYDLMIGLNITSTTNATADYFSIVAGDNPPAFRSSIGNLTYTTWAVGVYWIGPLESARFMNETGYLRTSSGYYAGTISVLKVK